MGQAEKQINRLTFFAKFIMPLILLGFSFAWTIGVCFFGDKNRQPSPAAGCFGLFLFGGFLYYCIRYLFPLKQVWISEQGLRVCNFRDSVIVPFESIDEIHQQTNSNDRIVIVTLQVATPFGHRFTFLPANPKLTWWPFTRGEDEVVVELRDRVEAARQVGKLRAKANPTLGRSPMADDELDGTLSIHGNA